MSLSLLFVTALVTALSGAMMPGPVLFMTVRYSVVRGRWVGPLVVAGHAAVELPLMLAIIFGLDRLLRTGAFVGGVGLAGGAALLVMGVLMLRAVPTLSLPGRDASDPAEGSVSLFKPLGAGAVTSVANPYFFIWWATIGLRFMAGATPFGALGYAVFYTGHILGDLAWYAAVSESIHHGRRFLSDRSYRRLVGVCAVVLVGFAVYFGADGLLRLANL